MSFLVVVGIYVLVLEKDKNTSIKGRGNQAKACSMFLEFQPKALSRKHPGVQGARPLARRGAPSFFFFLLLVFHTLS